MLQIQNSDISDPKQYYYPLSELIEQWRMCKVHFAKRIL